MTIIGLCSVLEYRFKVWTRHKKSGLRLLMETALFHPKYAQIYALQKLLIQKNLNWRGSVGCRTVPKLAICIISPRPDGAVVL